MMKLRSFFLTLFPPCSPSRSRFIGSWSRRWCRWKRRLSWFGTCLTLGINRQLVNSPRHRGEKFPDEEEELLERSLVEAFGMYKPVARPLSFSWLPFSASPLLFTLLALLARPSPQPPPDQLSIEIRYESGIPWLFKKKGNRNFVCGIVSFTSACHWRKK